MQELIPFDYDLIKQGYKVVTRDGQDVSQITLFELKESKQIYGVVAGGIECFEISGSYFAGKNPAESTYDLFMVPPTTVKYINVYPESEQCFDYDHPRPRSHNNKGAFTIKVTYQADKPISVELT